MRRSSSLAIHRVLATALLFGALGVADAAFARVETIRWSHSDTSQVSTFRVYYGSATRQYGAMIEVGVPSIVDGTHTYDLSLGDTDVVYVAITAVGPSGLESAYSNEKFRAPEGWTAPPPDGGGEGDGGNSGSGNNGSPGDGGGPLPPLPFPENVYRLNAGGPDFVDSAGQSWASDEGIANTGNAHSVGTHVSGTNNVALYQSERWDPQDGAELRYALPVASGTYTVRLHFTEVWDPARAVGARNFDVALEGGTVLSSFDIFAAGGFATAVVREFTVQVDDGVLDLEFYHRVQNTKICGIEVLPISVGGDGGGSALGAPGRPQIVVP